MTNSRIRPVMVAMAAIILLAAAVPGPLAGSVGRPIKEDLAGYGTGMVLSPTFPAGDTFDGRCSRPSQWISTSAGWGVITHLGRVTWSSEHCFQLFEGTFTDARAVEISANGDRLFATYDGSMTGETSFAEVLTITGGTGRFAGATGTIHETGWFDPESGYMEVTGAGSIVYDAANRASN